MTAFTVRPDMKPSAPVNGGMRWRTSLHDLRDLARERRGYNGYYAVKPDRPEREPYLPDPGSAAGPRITGDPPTRARAGEEYIHQPRASDGAVDGFTWYLEKCPPGMIVDRHTGRISWTPAEGGYVEVVLCARSLYGTEGRSGWTIHVRRAAAVRVFTAHPRFLAALRRKRLRHAAAARATIPPHAGDKPLCPAPFPTAERRWSGPALRAPPASGLRCRAMVPLRI